METRFDLGSRKVGKTAFEAKDRLRKKNSDKEACGRDPHTLVQDRPGNLAKNTKGPFPSCFKQPGALCSKSPL